MNKNIIYTIILFILPVFLISFFNNKICFSADANVDNEYSKIIDENNELKKIVTQLTNELNEVRDKLKIAEKRLDDVYAPEKKYKYANELFESGNLCQSEKLFLEIVENYKCSKYEKLSKKRIEEIQIKRDLLKKEEEKLKILKRDGFGKIKQLKNIKINDVSITISDIGIRNEVIFDRNEYEYSYKTADKDSKYISLTLSISSNNKNPKLPAIYYGIINDEGKVCDIELFDYKFYKWSSYGAYLGNYSDKTNDFAKAKNIKFVALSQIPNRDINNKPVIIFTNREQCLDRRYNEYGSPPIFYSNYDCEKISKQLLIEDFAKDYTLIHLFKKK